MSVTCYYSGRWGNMVFHAAQLIAYAKKHNLQYFIPTKSVAYNHHRNGDVTPPFNLKSTGNEPINPTAYNEPLDSNGNPFFHEISKMDNVTFIGYYQSFRYFDWCRDYILETFNFPYEMKKGVVSISVRRGDCLEAPDKFPIAPNEYYYNAIKYMQDKGYNLFRVHSDDQPYCRNEFTTEKYNGAVFEFTEGDERNDFISIQNCAHNITARSTFSLTAAWFNQNPDKIVLTPTLKHRWWGMQNRDMLTGTNFIQIDFQNPF